MNEGNEISEFQYESEMRKVRIRRVRVIMKSEQISKNIITAIGTITLSLVTYRFNIINWNLTEHKENEAKFRKQLIFNRIHHTKF